MKEVLITETTTGLRPAAIQRPGQRVEAIDLLRGLVMIIMALDHTRDFFHYQAWTDDPLNLATTTPALFFTRWITHFCAPVFVFLAGTSAWFQSIRKSKKELSLFLISRGSWLLLIELFVVNFSFSFDPTYSIYVLQTIWAIGISMVILGLVIRLPYSIILALGLIIVLGHNSLDFYEAGHKGPYSFGYALLHHPAMFNLWPGHNLLVFYPFLSWSGLMMLGYCFGALFTRYRDPARKRILSRLGISIILFFIILRASNLYGNPEQWSAQKNTLFTFLSFIDTHKYPPSLLFMSMTIGPAILFTAWFGRTGNRLTRMISVYGKVPFFYYVLHFFLIHTLSMIAFLLRGHSFAEGIHQDPGPNFLPNFILPDEGYSLWVVYMMWIIVVAILYFPCKWFAQYKQTHKQWWLSYL